MDIVNMIVSVLSGVAAGNAAGAAMPADKNLGAVGNSITGLFGGGIGGYIVLALGFIATVGGTAAATGTQTGLENLDVSSLIANVAGSAAGGAILTIIVGFLKSALKKTY